MDKHTACFEFLCQFEDASPKERPQVLKRWTLAHPWWALIFRELARDVIRDEERARSLVGASM